MLSMMRKFYKFFLELGSREILYCEMKNLPPIFPFVFGLEKPGQLYY